MDSPSNRLHVLANDVVVPASPIAEIGTNDEHVAAVAEARARLVLEADAEIQRPVIDGVSDEVHDLPVDFGIRLAQLLLTLLRALGDLSAFLSGDPRHERPPAR